MTPSPGLITFVVLGGIAVATLIDMYLSASVDIDRKERWEADYVPPEWVKEFEDRKD